MHTNLLSKETSPYLLQHQHNPVDWHPWGEEAFAAARAQDKPIFLSVGYSTCYWCHVMERECFENEAIAAEMNKRFINIKVDREERPDVDQLYMNAVQVLTRHGGWPMSVFLTPGLKPFYGGTYFPPADVQGRPGFPRMLALLEDAYRNRHNDVEASADQLIAVLGQLARPPVPQEAITFDAPFIDRLIERSIADYDTVNGGFGQAPKFPRETLLELLLNFTRQGKDATPNAQMTRVAHRLDHTLRAMAMGGMRDQLGGGFHRYSTDAKWLVPHFEIMLYDNAMLGWCYAEAYAQTGDEVFAQVARGVFDFILRDMTSPEGAFYTALDAEVDAREGEPYLWTSAELEVALGRDDAELFGRMHGLNHGPNFSDPHHGDGVPQKNVLYLAERPFEMALKAGMDAAELEARMASARQKLLAIRKARKQPALDTKVITSWNALMIKGLARGGAALAEPRYLDAAKKAADFILSSHVRPDGAIARTSRDGMLKHDGFLDDYAFLADALIELSEATGEAKWRDAARQVADGMLSRFDGGQTPGLYFSSSAATDLIVRQKVAADSPLPSGNAAAALALLRLGDVDAARAIVSAFASWLHQGAEGMSAMVQAAMLLVAGHGTFIAGGVPGGAPAGAGAAPDPSRPDVPQTNPAPATALAEILVHWIAPADSPTGHVELQVTLTIARGMHFNANPAGPGLIPTTISVLGAAGDQLVAIDYPPGAPMSFSYVTASVPVYEGRPQITLKFPADFSQDLSVSIRYQACNDRACFAPQTLQIDVPARK